MSTLVYMKLLEQTPEKYDRGMRVMTLGRINQIKKYIANEMIEPGDSVLEIGCGTGSLASAICSRGAKVTGIDISSAMVTLAIKNAPQAEFFRLSAVELDNLSGRKFDKIIATLSFSEMTEDERDIVLREIRKLLLPGGKLIIADEVQPEGFARKLCAVLVRWPLAALTFLLTQNTTHALKDFTETLENAEYRVLSTRDYLAGTLTLFVAEAR